MAESVINQLLSAVTEGHRSGAISCRNHSKISTNTNKNNNNFNRTARGEHREKSILPKNSISAPAKQKTLNTNQTSSKSERKRTATKISTETEIKSAKLQKFNNLKHNTTLSDKVEEDCVALRTRSKTLLKTNLPITDNLEEIKQISQKEVTEQILPNPLIVKETLPHNNIQNKVQKTNLLNYYRKTRGNRTFSSKNNSKEQAEKNSTSFNIPEIPKSSIENKINNKTTKVEKSKNKRSPNVNASSSKIVRKLRSTTVPDLNSSVNSEATVLQSSVTENINQKIKSSNSYQSLFPTGAIPKKRQKFLDNLDNSSLSIGSSAPKTKNYSLINHNLAGVSSTATTTGYSKAPNLGARLARSGGANRDAAPQQQQTQGQNSSSGYLGESFVTRSASAGYISSSSTQSNILRRSSRSKTGSCVSSSNSHGGGSATAAPATSTVAAPSSSRSGHNYNNRSTSSTTNHSHKSNHHTGAETIPLMANDDRKPGSSENNGNQSGKTKSVVASSSSGLDMPSLHIIPTQAGSAPSALGQTSASTSAPGTATSHADSESDDSEVGRLQALLEARGLPPHLFGALGPRMSHILNRTIGSGSSSKAQQLLQGLQSHDESQQLQAAIEMCQMLVMGNEDTLAGFPIKQVVPALINLLRMEHNFDIMNNACRALAYMLEALPRSSGTVVDAIPVFLEKLQVIQCMDVAEQSLTALEILSRRHNKAILQANGISACLTYLDFFSINAQRAALAITGNCCLNLHPEEFHFINDSLPLLARLLAQQDKKCVESICTAFYRLVESFQYDPKTLQEIASKDLLKNCQQLLVLTPPVLNSGTFTNVVRMLSVMCSNCPELAISLLKSDIASTLLYLLTGSAEPSSTPDVELVSRSPSELYEITCLIGELMPRLPIDGIFSVDNLLERTTTTVQDQVQWQWRDDRGVWHSYSAIDSRMIEAAHLNTDDEIGLSALGRSYTIDFHSMQQINEETGTTRPVQRKMNINYLANISIGHDFTTTNSSTNPNTNHSNPTILDENTRASLRDARIACVKEERGLASEFIKNLFSVLYEVYSSSAGPAVRYKCLRALLRMVYYASADLLKNVLKNQIVSSHIAGMMASNDLRIVVGALQMAEILMQKLPDVFGTHFRREGVIHQITQLADPNNPICVNPSPKQVIMSGTLSAPPTASITHSNPFDFESYTTQTTTKNHGSHIKNLNNAMNALNPKMSISMPTTSSNASLQIPSTSSSSLAISLNTKINPPITPDIQAHVMASSLPNNSNFFMYSSSIDPRQFNHYHYPPPHFQTHHADIIAQPIQGIEGSNSNAIIASTQTTTTTTSGGQSKVSEMLRRKVPPKRKSQSSGRSKSRQEDSVVQELINRAAAIGNSTSSRNTPSSSNTRSRFGISSGAGSSSTKSSFLASLNPARWGRQNAHHNTFTKDNNSTTSSSSLAKSASNANIIAAGNREKARQWIREQSVSFINRYTEQETAKSTYHPTASVLTRLGNVILKLDRNYDDCLEALTELKNILIESDISPFEVNHSGLIKAMLKYMSSENGIVPRDTRLRIFLHIFAGLPLTPHIIGIPNIKSSAFSTFVAKLNGCVTQLEQFPVKVHDFLAGPGGRSNTSALKFFNTHQLKCNLQRHPECSNLRQWKGGTVKIDPLALVQAIERYLVVRGYGGIRGGDSDDDSEEDMDDNVASVVMSQVYIEQTSKSGMKHKLQFSIGNNILPYNMTVYQAVKQYSPLATDQSETDTDTEAPIGSASIWVKQHTIFYRPIDDETANSSSTNKVTSTNAKKGNKGSTKITKRKTEFWHEGIVHPVMSSLHPFLKSSLPSDIVSVQDASLDALCMLRIINGLNRHWECLYDCVYHENIINNSEFIHSKITAKANRQLQDPLVIMTGNLPHWLHQIALSCPFLFPFESRHLLFYAVSFDRDRALQRLLDTTPDLISSDTSERVAPRLDRRKRAISRDDILKQAEHVIQDFGHSKALLEIQYENEVGTGLGPTLEFYALVSAELQRCDLGLWNESDSYKQNSSNIVDVVKPSTAQIEDNNDNIRNSKNSRGIVNTNNTLNNQSTIDKSLYVNHENTLNMIIEQTDNIGTPQHSSTPNSALLAVRESEQENIINQENMDRTVLNNIISRNLIQPPSAVRKISLNYVNAPHGLFPIPLGKAAKLSQISRVKTKFKFLGKFIAKAVMDSRMLDLPFSIPFYRWLLHEETKLGLAELARITPEVQATLVRLQDVIRKRDFIQGDMGLSAMEKTEKIENLDLDGCPIADLGLDFVLPGHANIELRRGGRDIPVTIHNLHQYILLVTHWFLVEGVQRQFEALREGFDTVFPSQRLKLFYPEELENVFCGTGTSNYQRWDIRMLQDCCRTDHGFSQDSAAIQYLYEILSSYNRDEQRLFLQFVTGSPRLPTGGFKSLTPPLTIVRKTLDINQNPDDYLPSVMTCVNYLKLPDYTNREVMRAKLKMAANEGSMSFHLS